MVANDVLRSIKVGDEVTLVDGDGNKIVGRVLVDPFAPTTSLVVEAFGVRIPFAKFARGGWQRVGGVTVTDHQAGMW